MSIARSLLYGVANLLHPRMLWLMLWPMLIALAIWGTAAIALWVRVATLIAGVLQRWLEAAMFFANFNLSDVTLIAAHVLLFLLFVPLVYLTALFILGVFGMQAMVDHVARGSFPELERRRGGGVAGSGWNGLIALFGMLGLGVRAQQPLMAPAEDADRAEMARIFRERRGGLYLLGLQLALLAYVPVLGFIAPVVFGLAFIHYLLGALQAARRHD